MSGVSENDKNLYKESCWTAFIAWCGNILFTLKLNRTKEIGTAFIFGEVVEVVEGYKHLSAHLDIRLNWRLNSETIYKKEHNRLDF